MFQAVHATFKTDRKRQKHVKLMTILVMELTLAGTQSRWNNPLAAVDYSQNDAVNLFMGPPFNEHRSEGRNLENLCFFFLFLDAAKV